MSSYGREQRQRHHKEGWDRYFKQQEESKRWNESPEGKKALKKSKQRKERAHDRKNRQKLLPKHWPFNRAHDE